MSLTLIEHGYVVPVATDEVIEDGAVAFEEDRIVYVGKSADFDRRSSPPAKVIDAGGKAVLPGLVNTHCHLVGAYMKGLTEDVPGKADTAGLYKRGFPVVCSLAPDDVYPGAMTHSLEMLMTGTTTINNTWIDERRIGPVFRDLGVRGVLSEWIVGTDLLKLSARNMERPWDPAMVERGLDNAAELYENWHGKADGRSRRASRRAGPAISPRRGSRRRAISPPSRMSASTSISPKCRARRSSSPNATASARWSSAAISAS